MEFLEDTKEALELASASLQGTSTMLRSKNLDTARLGDLIRVIDEVRDSLYETYRIEVQRQQ